MKDTLIHRRVAAARNGTNPAVITRMRSEILGNTEPALHAHLFPRYDSEPEEFRSGPVWLYDWSTAPAFDRGSYAAFIDSVGRALAVRAV